MIKRTQGERLVAIETKLEGVAGDITEIKEALTKHIELEDKKYDSLRKEFAAKWSERAIYAIMIILVGIAFKVMVGG